MTRRSWKLRRAAAALLNFGSLAALLIFGAGPASADVTLQYTGSAFDSHLCAGQMPAVCLGSGWINVTMAFSGIIPAGYTGNILSAPGVALLSGSAIVSGFPVQTGQITIASPGIFLQAGKVVSWSVFFGQLSSFTGADGDIAGSTLSSAGDNVFFETGGVFYNGVSASPGAWFVSVTPLPPIQITTSTLPDALSKQPYSATLTASGGTGAGYVWTLSSGSLPAGFTLSRAGILSATGGGSPAVQTYNFSVRVIDSGSDTTTQSLSLRVLPALQVTSTTLSPVVSGQSYSTTLSVTGGTGAGYVWSLFGGTIPPGFSLSPGGVFAAPVGNSPPPQPYSFTVKVTDSGGNSALHVLTLTVQPALQITTMVLADAIAGQAYSVTLAATGGTGTGFAWSVAVGPLPTGFSLTPGGVLAVPATASPAAQLYTFAVKVTDSGGNTATQPLSINVQPGLQITTTTLPGAISGQPYSATLSATGGTGMGYKWTLSSGSAAGFTLSAGGVLSSTGTPAATAQTYTLTVKVADSGTGTSTMPLMLAVQGALQITTAKLANAVNGQPYTATMACSGGTGMGYVWSLAMGNLPPGFSLTGSGVLSSSGSPPALTGSMAQSWTVTFNLSDSAAAYTVSKQFTLLVNPVPSTPPAIRQGGVVPVYSSSTTIEPGSWISIYGTNLAGGTTVWNGDFPTSLGGVSVTINSKPCAIWFVSPTQINIQAPDDTATGTVPVAVTTSMGTGMSTVTLGQYAPSFTMLSAKYPAAIVITPDKPGNTGGGYDIIGPNGAFAYPTRPVKAGETIVLYGVGFGPTNPAVAAGQAFSGAAPCVTKPQVTIGGVNATVVFAGMVGAGLYQLNVVVPNAGTGDKALRGTVGGASTGSNVMLTLQ